MEQTFVRDKHKGKCARCHKLLLLGFNDFCITCENDHLHVELVNRDLIIARLKKESRKSEIGLK